MTSIQAWLSPPPCGEPDDVPTGYPSAPDQGERYLGVVLADLPPPDNASSAIVDGEVPPFSWEKDLWDVCIRPTTLDGSPQTVGGGVQEAPHEGAREGPRGVVPVDHLLVQECYSLRQGILWLFGRDGRGLPDAQRQFCMVFDYRPFQDRVAKAVRRAGAWDVRNH